MRNRPSTLRSVVTLLAVATICICVGLALRKTLLARSPSPRIEYTLLDGTHTSSDHWRGKVVLVNFWSTDCQSCVHEMTQLIATDREFVSRGFETLAVSMSYDPPSYVTRFATSRQLPFGVTIDRDGVIAKRFGDVEFTPVSFLIDRHGDIFKRFVGELDREELQKSVDKLLSES